MTMPALLTDRQLHEHILALKDNLDDYDQDHSHKLAFFNAYSFYDHVTRQPVVAHLLNAIEPYIPISLNPSALEMFIHAAGDCGQTEDYADLFMIKARVDFMDSLQKANTPEEWSRLVGICGAIRDVKETLYMAN
jgi:hypothetical protein